VPRLEQRIAAAVLPATHAPGRESHHPWATAARAPLFAPR
jgi:hypothetical protein